MTMLENKGKEGKELPIGTVLEIPSNSYRAANPVKRPRWCDLSFIFQTTKATLDRERCDTLEASRWQGKRFTQDLAWKMSNIIHGSKERSEHWGEAWSIYLSYIVNFNILSIWVFYAYSQEPMDSNKYTSY